MKFFSKCKDGGPESPVTGYFLVEIKSLFSVVLLHFNGTREAYHSHAFNALTLWLSGAVEEMRLIPKATVSGFVNPANNGTLFDTESHLWAPLQLKYTPRECFHQVQTKGAWALSVRGPWSKTWQEHKGNVLTTLTHGRRVVDEGTFYDEGAFSRA